jgi:hypothetical protein
MHLKGDVAGHNQDMNYMYFLLKTLFFPFILSTLLGNLHLPHWKFMSW